MIYILLNRLKGYKSIQLIDSAICVRPEGVKWREQKQLLNSKLAVWPFTCTVSISEHIMHPESTKRYPVCKDPYDQKSLHVLDRRPGITAGRYT